MARHVCPELIGTDDALKRYVRHQYDHLRALQYPRMATFAKDIARGTVSLAPTPEDPVMEAIGRFLFTVLGEIERRILLARHDGTGESRYTKAHHLGMTERQWKAKTERLLWQLKGFLGNLF